MYKVVEKIKEKIDILVLYIVDVIVKEIKRKDI